MHKLSLTEDPTVGNNDEVDGDEIEVGNDIMDEYDYIASSSSDDESSGVESDNDETGEIHLLSCCFHDLRKLFYDWAVMVDSV